ncbi:hypothetical protein M885DRAFT_626979, partial [Pelagophyceae sp. CCMP2097]
MSAAASNMAARGGPPSGGSGSAAPGAAAAQRPLVALVAADISSALVAGLLCSPLVGAIDRAVTLHAAGAAPLWPTLWASLRSPRLLVSGPAPRLIFAVYASTYTAANCADTLSGSPAAVLAASTLTNTSACIAKDRAFARMFGATAPRPMPLASLCLWVCRDSVTMAFVFSLPPLLAAARGVDGDAVSAATHFAAPIAAQVLTTPLHLAGLGLYNAPGASPRDHWLSLRQKYAATVLARQLRVVPAFSLGGAVNRALRAKIHAHFDPAGSPHAAKR